MSLLKIIQGTMLRTNMPVPVSAFGNPDPTVQEFIAFAQDAGDEMVERWHWRSLKYPLAGTPATITGDGHTTVFSLPTGWGRFSPSDTLTSSVYPTLVLRGPMNEDDLLRMKALPFVPLPSVWRLIGDATGLPQIEFFPAPGAGEVISYVYGAYKWIIDATNVPQVEWTADTNNTLIAERLIRLGTIWRWKKSKGLDYSEEFRMTEASLDRRAGQESQEREVSMARWPISGPEWWPGTITDNTSKMY